MIYLTCGDLQRKCGLNQLPGSEVYRKQELRVFAMDGSVGVNYCSGLGHLAQFFSSHASLCDDPALYVYNVLYRVNVTEGCHFIGYSAKVLKSMLCSHATCQEFCWNIFV